MDLRELEFVLVAGHFLARDENIFTIFEGEGGQEGGGSAAADEAVVPLLHELPSNHALPAAAAAGACCADPATCSHHAVPDGLSTPRVHPAAPPSHQIQHPPNGRWVPTPPLSIFGDLATGSGERGTGMGWQA